MAHFIANCPDNCESVLRSELLDHGFKARDVIRGGVYFEGSWKEAIRAHFDLHIPNRITLPVRDFTAYEYEELYNQVKKHDFTKYINPNQTMKVRTRLTNCKLRLQNMITLKVKDAIADQFMDKFGSRPDVNKERADLNILVTGKKNHFYIHIDLTGVSLGQRGYRIDGGDAPIKENLASALLAHSGWQINEPLIDPMCGSGTFLIEAALSISPLNRNLENFSVSRFKSFEKFNPLSIKGCEKPKLNDAHLYGYDINQKMIEFSQSNAERAKVDSFIKFKQIALKDLVRPSEISEELKGKIICNPPYDERLSSDLRDLFSVFEKRLRQEFRGWSLWILSPEPQIGHWLRMKSNQRIPINNGPIKCQFSEYKID